MKIFFLILGIAGAEQNTPITYVKIPIINELERITCDEAFIENTKWVLNPRHEPGNYEVWGFYVYNNRPIFLHYCQDQNGDWVR